MYYYRESTKDNYEDDIKNLNNKIDIVYTSLENIIQDRNDLLQLFNSRINDNIPNENIFHDDINVDADNRFKLIFTCKSKPSGIYKYTNMYTNTWFPKKKFQRFSKVCFLMTHYYLYLLSNIFVSKFDK